MTYPTDLHSQPNAVAVAHLRNNQQLDIVIAYFGNNSIGVLRGLGNGSFVSHTHISTGASRPITIHAAHLDNDTFLDLITADYGTDSITIYFGDGTGHFEYRKTYATGYDSLPVFITSGDLNGDNRLDLAVAKSGTHNVELFFGGSDGEIVEQQVFILIQTRSLLVT